MHVSFFLHFIDCVQPFCVVICFVSDFVGAVFTLPPDYPSPHLFTWLALCSLPFSDGVPLGRLPQAGRAPCPSVSPPSLYRRLAFYVIVSVNAGTVPYTSLGLRYLAQYLERSVFSQSFGKKSF